MPKGLFNRSGLVGTGLLAMGLVLVLGLALAGQDKSGEMRLLGEGQVWRVEFPPGEYAYRIEYLKGDMFITVAADFLGPDDRVLHTATHTLIQNERMAAQQVFKADKVADQAPAKAIRFQCDSGMVRIRFGASKDVAL